MPIDFHSAPFLRQYRDEQGSFRARHSTGRVVRNDSRVIARCIDELLEEGYLRRCRVTDAELGTVTTPDRREIAVSSWIEDPEGEWIVIANWVPAQTGMTPETTRAWHATRRERMAATLDDSGYIP